MKLISCPECGEPIQAECTYYSEEYDLPLGNLDFRMKMEAFLEVWQDIPFTELKERLNAHNNR